MPQSRLILLRHGESLYNQQGVFTGWTDVELSPKGREEAEDAGKRLLAHGLYPDICFTSWLKRSIHTAQIALAAMEWEHIDLHRSWRLNERHYGAWQGQKKEMVKAEVGEAHFLAVRRGYDTPPPPLDDEAYERLRQERKYHALDPSLLPRSESLKDTHHRVIPYWKSHIIPELKRGRTVLLSAHGNSLRALLMELDRLTPEEIVKTEIPTGVPICYTFDETLQVARKVYLE